MSNVMHTIGSFTGKTAAYAWEGSRLGATAFAQGAREGYALKAEELRARREALALTTDTGERPVIRTQRRVKTAA